MIYLYFIIVFFILLFNILIPTLINRIQIENEILNSDLGKSLKTIKCHDNGWFYLDHNIKGLQIYYYVDTNNKILTCDKEFTSVNKQKLCGEEGEYNNRYHSCFTLLSELLFYRSIK